jgi:hypothetical protein
VLSPVAKRRLGNQDHMRLCRSEQTGGVHHLDTAVREVSGQSCCQARA